MNFRRNRYNDLSAGDVVKVILLIVTVFLAVGIFMYGWVMNLVALAHTVAFSGMVVLRAIGVFVPVIGAVLGYV